MIVYSADMPFYNLSTNSSSLICFILSLLVMAAIDVPLFLWFKRNLTRIFIVVDEVILFLAWGFNLDLLLIVSSIAMISGLFVFALINSTEIRHLVANPTVKEVKMPSLAKNRRNNGKIQAEVLFDREATYKEVETAVLELAKRKIGALITFVKDEPIPESSMKNAQPINAPVRASLLETIFYPGTRLHDGAVIIKDNQIVAANVFFALNPGVISGTYGSRHRAALSVSDLVPDCVTVVVSEERGTISIVQDGELNIVPPEKFLHVFETYMSVYSEKKE